MTLPSSDIDASKESIEWFYYFVLRKLAKKRNMQSEKHFTAISSLSMKYFPVIKRASLFGLKASPWFMP
jgi:hypothetical protein